MSRLSRWTLSNGLSVLYLQDAGLPLTSVTLILPSGSRWEALSQAGLSSMSIDLMMQGTRKRDAKGIARQMESIGASMGTQAHEDYSEMGFIAPAQESRKAFHMMAEILQEPSFPSDEIKKERAHILAGLQSRKDAIFHLTYDHFSRALYGDHPYGRPLEGHAKTVQRFNRGELRSWNRRHVLPEGGVLSIVAPDSVAQMQRMIQTTIGRWQPSARPSEARGVPHLVRPLGKSVSRTERSSFKQAYLMTGWQAPSSRHQDQLSVKVLNTILGGGMSSLLFVKLREELGLAYEVSSFYPSRLDKSQWVIYLGLPAERLKLASERLERLLDDFARKGPTDNDLRQAKAMIRGAFLMDRQSRRRQGWYNAWWEFLGRGLNYSSHFLRAIDQVSADDVRDRLRTFMNQPRVTVKVIPDAK